MRTSLQAKFEPFNAHEEKIAIVAAQFNADITESLVRSALARAADYQLDDAHIDIFKVAGAIEIPLILQKLAASHTYFALLAIGCVIKGDTSHFEYVCKFVTEGILRVSLDTNVPIGFGVLTCNTIEQAESRSELGGEHLDAALQQARVLREIS